MLDRNLESFKSRFCVALRKIIDLPVLGVPLGAFLSPRRLWGEVARTLRAGEGAIDRLRLADSPPHPETSLRFVSDLSPQAGRGEACALFNGHSFAISRRASPELCQSFSLPSNRRARGSRAPDAPDSRVCNGSGSAHTR